MPILAVVIALGVAVWGIGPILGFGSDSGRKQDLVMADNEDSTISGGATSTTTPAPEPESAVPTPAPTVPEADEFSTQDQTTLLPGSELTTHPAGVSPAQVGSESNVDPIAVAHLLADTIVIPSDCGIPLDEPASLPNSERSYRNGVHAGIDFICSVTGRTAVAALPGRVVMARGDFTEPTVADRNAVLDIAARTNQTPPWILAMLYGNFVVIDHGIVDGVGHVVTIYAHFERLADGLRTAETVEAGDPIGIIGNTGTHADAANNDNLRSLHLHWEVHVDDLYLGYGLDASATRSVYATLFSLD